MKASIAHNAPSDHKKIKRKSLSIDEINARNCHIAETWTPEMDEEIERMSRQEYPRKRRLGTAGVGGTMIQENQQPGFAAFAEAFGDIFGDIFAEKDVAAEQKKLEFKCERQPIQVETRARLTGERVREIVSDGVEELADFVELLVLDQREILERQHAAQLDQLSKIVAFVGLSHGAKHCGGSLEDRRICVENLRETALKIGHATVNGVAVEELIKHFLLQLDEVSVCPCMTMGTGGFGAAA